MSHLSFKEQRQHGQLSLYEHDGKGMLFPCHWHDEYEMLCFEKGDSLLTLDGKTIQMHSGEFVFLNPGELHTVSACDASKVYALVFKLYDVNGYFKNTIEDKALASQIFCSAMAGNTPLKLKSQLYALLHEQKTDQKSYQNESMKQVLSYMEQHFTEPLTIDELAAKANLSKHHFIRVFELYTAATPIAYRNTLRIGKAIELLQAEDLSVTQIATSCGFDNISYFIQVFKKQTGLTPYAFKQRKH